MSVRREAGTQASRCSSRRGPSHRNASRTDSRTPRVSLSRGRLAGVGLGLEAWLCCYIFLDLPSQRRPAGPPDPRPTYSASASHLPRPSEHPTDTHVSLPAPPVYSLKPQHGCARVHEADWREAVALEPVRSRLVQPCALAPVHAHSSHAHLVHVHRFGGKKRKESEAATKVQAQVRGQQARKSVSGMKKCGAWCKCFSSAKA